MTAPADHVLVTRYNVPTPGSETRVRAQEGWLRRRVELFERYCLPSVIAQSDRDFGWLVYFDPASPQWLRERIDRWVLASPLTPLFRVAVPREDLLQDAARVTGRRHDELITTNLDNDDGLAVDFVERLHLIPTSAPRTALYCGNGLIAADARVYLRHDPSNAFCSVREPWAGARTCWADWHNRLGEHMPVHVLEGDPAWLQVVHDTNVSNRVRGRLVDPYTYRDRFPGLIDDLPHVSPAALRRDHWVEAPARALRDAARSTARRAATRLGGKEGFDRAQAARSLATERIRRLRPRDRRPEPGSDAPRQAGS